MSGAAIASTSPLGQANALFKVQFADKVTNLVPKLNPILRDITFVGEAQKHGSAYVWPVILSQDQGFTCHGPNGNVYAMNNAVLHVAAQAQVTAAMYSGRTMIGMEVLSRAVANDRAFVDGVSHYVEALTTGFSNMVEGIHWHGREGMGKATYDSATVALRLSFLEAAPFLFLGGEGMPVDIYNDVSGEPGSTLVAATSLKVVRIGTSDGGTTEDGGITLTLDSGAGLSNGVSYHIFRKGYRNTESFGALAILRQDVVFGIDATVNSLWRANRDSVSAALSYSKFSKAVALGIGRGLSGPLSCYARAAQVRQLFPDAQGIGERTTANLNTIRRVNSAEEAKKFKHGTQKVDFIVDSIDASIESTEFLKGKQMVCIDKATAIRVGSTGVTFGTPGLNIDGQQYLRPLENMLAAELRIMTDEALILEAPNKCLVFDNLATI